MEEINKEIVGIVVKGTLIGRRLGFPTINVEYDRLDLPHGVYLCKVNVSNTEYFGAMHFGPKATMGMMEPSLEVYLLDFSGDIYGQTVKIRVVEKIREVRAFDSLESLKKQLRLDVDHVRAYMLK
jgi:FAD synthase